MRWSVCLYRSHGSQFSLAVRVEGVPTLRVNADCQMQVSHTVPLSTIPAHWPMPCRSSETARRMSCQQIGGAGG